METSSDYNRILVVAPHMDDEVLGCGGTIARHTGAGDVVYVSVLCKPAPGRQTSEQVSAVVRTLRLQGVALGEIADQTLDTIPMAKLIDRYRVTLRQLKPQVVYIPFVGDANRDHQLVAQALLVAARPSEPYIEALLAYETPGSTEWGYPQVFRPDTYVDVSKTLHLKVEAFMHYTSEIQPYPSPRSIHAIGNHAHVRGVEAGLEAAEGFMTIYRRY